MLGVTSSLTSDETDLKLCRRCNRLLPNNRQNYYIRSNNTTSSYCVSCVQALGRASKRPKICLILVKTGGTIEQMVEGTRGLRKRLVRSGRLPANNNIYLTKDLGEDVYHLDKGSVITFPTFLKMLQMQGLTLDDIETYRFNLLWRTLKKI